MRGHVRDDEGFYKRDNSPRNRGANRSQRPRQTIGLGQRRKLRVVAVQRFDVFVTRLHPDTSVEDIKENVHDVLGDAAVTVTKLRTRRDTYASFRVSCQQRPHYDALLDPYSWDEGALVREFVPSSERPPQRPYDQANERKN